MARTTVRVTGGMTETECLLAALQPPTEQSAHRPSLHHGGFLALCSNRCDGCEWRVESGHWSLQAPPLPLPGLHITLHLPVDEIHVPAEPRQGFPSHLEVLWEV